VAAFRFSRRVEVDLLSIGDYTLRAWGKAQAARYLGELEACWQTLSDNPALGRLCDEVRPGLRRLKHGQHVVFYRQERGGILVSRILHQRMRGWDKRSSGFVTYVTFFGHFRCP
jgi:toxin ParE1/3/4